MRYYLWRYFADAPDPLNAPDLNIVNLMFLLAGFSLHGTPGWLMHRCRQRRRRCGRAVAVSVPCGYRWVITSTHLNEQLGCICSRVDAGQFSSAGGCLLAVFGVFVLRRLEEVGPAPCHGGCSRSASRTWMVVTAHDLVRRSPTSCNPSDALPVLGLFHLRARDVMGYTFVVFPRCCRCVLLLVTLLGLTPRISSEFG